MHIFHLVHNSSRLSSFVHILLQQKTINNIEIHIQLQPADCASILCQQLRLVFYLLYMVYGRNKKLQQEAGCAAIAQKTSDIYVYVYVCRLTHIHTYRLHIIYKYVYILKRMYLYNIISLCACIKMHNSSKYDLFGRNSRKYVTCRKVELFAEQI